MVGTHPTGMLCCYILVLKIGICYFRVCYGKSKIARILQIVVNVVSEDRVMNVFFHQLYYGMNEIDINKVMRLQTTEA